MKRTRALILMLSWVRSSLYDDADSGVIVAEKNLSAFQVTADERPSRRGGPGKKAGSGRLTAILAVIFVAVAVVGLIVATTGRDSYVAPVSIDAGMIPNGAAAGSVAQEQAPAGEATENAWCRSYVFTRCNVLAVKGTDCVPISRVAVQVPLASGVAGCRAAVDAMLADAAGIRDDGDAVVAVVDAGGAGGEGQASASGSVAQVAADEQEKAEDGAPPEVVKKKIDPEVNAAGIARINQLMTEIDVARNTYTGTGIGVQARLDEIREIAAGLDTDEAKKMYNNLIERLGRAGRGPSTGNSVSGPSGSVTTGSSTTIVDSQPAAVQAVPTTAVEAAPSSF